MSKPMHPEDAPTPDQPDPFAGLRYGAGEAPAEPSAPIDLEPGAAPHRGRSKRVVATIVGVGTLGAVAGGLALTQGGGGGSLAPSLVTRAAYVTAREPGFKLAMTIDATVGGRAAAITANGSFATGPPPQGTMTLVAPGGVSVSEILVGPDIFMQLPAAEQAALAPTPWVKATAATLTSASGFSFSPTPDSNPTDELNLLRGAGSVSDVGSETIRGVPTTHYHAVIDLNRYPSAVAPSLRAAAGQNSALIERVTGQSTLPADVWIDGDGLVRRIAVAFSLCSSAGTVAATVSMDFYDYGRQPAVTAPAASQVTDITSRIASQTANATSQLGC